MSEDLQPSTLLRATDLVKRYPGHRAGEEVVAVDHVSLDIRPGEALGIIGESGSGKSTLGRLLLGLDAPDEGEIHFEGQNLTAMTRGELRALRSRVSVVFQEPFSSLNPRLSIRNIIGEPLAIHRPSLSSAKRQKLIEGCVEMVGLPQSVLPKRARELSGGQQQRVGIARAMILRPHMVVLDEPTSSLDVMVKADILTQLLDLRAEFQTGFLVISHDIDTIRALSDSVAVMYRGRIVESGPAETVLTEPREPYTQRLLQSRVTLN